MPVLGVRGCKAPHAAELLEIFDLQAVAAQEELRIERHAAVTGRQHEPVATSPIRVGWVVSEVLLEQEVGRRRQRHRSSWVSMTSVLHSVSG